MIPTTWIQRPNSSDRHDIFICTNLNISHVKGDRYTQKFTVKRQIWLHQSAVRKWQHVAPKAGSSFNMASLHNLEMFQKRVLLFLTYVSAKPNSKGTMAQNPKGL